MAVVMLLLCMDHAPHLHVAIALVDAYAKLPRASATARAMFDEMPHQDVVTWTSLLTELAHTSAHGTVVCAYHGMVASGI